MSAQQIENLRVVIKAQKKKHSFVEALISTFVGFIVSLTAGIIIYPLFGISNANHILGMTLIFTALSVVRGYYVRRLFDWLHRKDYL